MSDEPDFKTTDIGAILAGISYPKTVVSVYMDESLGYLIYETDKELQKLSNLGRVEEYNKLEEELDKLRETANKARYEVHLTGVSRKTKKDLLTTVMAEFPTKTDVFGRVESNFEADEAYANKKWAVHIEKIVAPDGSILAPVLPEDVAFFRDNAPEPALDAIEAAIMELSDGVKSGFEIAAQDPAFLSMP